MAPSDFRSERRRPGLSGVNTTAARFILIGLDAPLLSLSLPLDTVADTFAAAAAAAAAVVCCVVVRWARVLLLLVSTVAETFERDSLVSVGVGDSLSFCMRRVDRLSTSGDAATLSFGFLRSFAFLVGGVDGVLLVRLLAEADVRDWICFGPVETGEETVDVNSTNDLRVITLLLIVLRRDAWRVARCSVLDTATAVRICSFCVFGVALFRNRGVRQTRITVTFGDPSTASLSEVSLNDDDDDDDGDGDPLLTGGFDAGFRFDRMAALRDAETDDFRCIVGVRGPVGCFFATFSLFSPSSSSSFSLLVDEMLM